MDADFWQDKWAYNEIGFHQEEINPYLNKYWSRLGLKNEDVVLVPFCGKSKDMVWIVEQGCSVIGIEICELAVKAFFDEIRLKPHVTKFQHFECWVAGDYTILCGDFLSFDIHDIGRFSAIYDRASLIALPADMRDEYAFQIEKYIDDSQAKMLLVTMEYPQDDMDGPPFTVTEDLVCSYYDGWDIEKLETADILKSSPQLIERGVTQLKESVYLLESP